MNTARKALANGAMYVTKANSLDLVNNDTLITTVIIADFDRDTNKEKVVSMSREDYINCRTRQRNRISIRRNPRKLVDDFGKHF